MILTTNKPQNNSDNFSINRQKIDEPPTPYRHTAEGYDSECENNDALSHGSARSNDNNHKQEPKHQWEALSAQLSYQESLQNLPLAAQQPQPSIQQPVPSVVHLGSSSQADRIRLHLNEFGETSQPQYEGGYDLTSARTNQSDLSVRFGGEKPSLTDEPFAEEKHVLIEPGAVAGVDSPHKKDIFKQKRLAHYNEFKVLQSLRSKDTDEEEEEEEEDEDD